MQTTKEVGNKGENLAKEYLIKKGYNIRDCNWRFGHFEIDIVAENNDYIIFFEIKTRSSTTTVKTPEEFVSKQQQLNIIRAVNAYMDKKKCTKEARFDIITIIHTAYKTDIQHIEFAFSPRW